ncbi:lysine N(6)-hydroxylase/L-ornithine N(5)-oxygenase family protein [Saliterribacillus persicus]|uniref:L-lysine N6-monooxygenase MbtG n=1 Tax=Saliterribacillus persicus TaxID=930114 RepID=A0A368XWQ9_9BACI|nr:SidA/IucD/PvdA family monooxygenase [Saliterribacillus persicus]RCW71909.1 lysine N6-hydroxylase [Saliterribacillus persicus]
MKESNLYDVIGIGIGPYNLGLAALIEERSNLKALFFDQTEELNWHPGMLIDGTDLQVPFIADLVTFANPTSKFTFLNYLHTKNRLHKYFFFHQFEMPRQEYNAYVKWVVKQLPTCQFQSEVIDVQEFSDHYEVKVHHSDQKITKKYRTKHIVLGTGTTPSIPINNAAISKQKMHHSSEYTFYKKSSQKGDKIVVIGSGQSAAEIFYDLLKIQDEQGYHLTWFTRSPGFLQLDNSMLGQEVFSPDYVDYFHGLDFEERIDSLDHLGQLRKGIDGETLKSIYKLLYHKSIDNKPQPIIIQPATEINHVENKANALLLEGKQWQSQQQIIYKADKVILATGYKPNIPKWFYKRFEDKIEWEGENLFKVDKNFKISFKDQTRENFIYTLTNLEHSHGTGATNLGLAVDRNMQIINEIAGKTLYPLQRDTVFSQFQLKNSDQD